MYIIIEGMTFEDGIEVEVEGADDDIDILSKPIGVWDCSSDIFPIWDKLSECDNQIKQQKQVSLCNYSK